MAKKFKTDMVKDPKNKRVLLISFLLGLACTALTVFFNDHIGNDNSVYYTRMAHEFIEGNYEYAFFHSMPPLTPTLAGLVGKLGFSAWMSMKLVSCLFFLASIYWVYRLACLRLSPEKAQWCSLLFVACSRLLRYGMAGQLDSAKIFLLIFVFERAINFIQSKRWTLLFQASIGSALLGLCRNEGVGYLPLICIFIFFSEWIFPTKKISVWQKLIKGVGQNVLVLSICLLIWSPWMVYEYRITGYPVLGSKQIPVLQKVLPFLNIEGSPYTKAGNTHNREIKYKKKDTTYLNLINNADLEKNKALNTLLKKKNKKPKSHSVHSKIVETVKGIYPPYIFLVILGVWSLFKSKGWTRIDSLFAAVFIYNILLQWVLVPNVIKRLVAPTIPFYFPWFIIGFDVAKRYCKEKLTLKNIKNARVVGYCILCLVVVIMLWDGMSSTRKSLRGKDKTNKQIALWIREHREQLDFNKTEPLKSTIYPVGYHNGRQPVIVSLIPQIVTWAEADLVQIFELRGQKILNSFREHNVDLLIVENKFKKIFPNFHPTPPHFKLISNKWEDRGILIYSFSPLTIQADRLKTSLNDLPKLNGLQCFLNKI